MATLDHIYIYKYEHIYIYIIYICIAWEDMGSPTRKKAYQHVQVLTTYGFYKAILQGNIWETNVRVPKSLIIWSKVYRVKWQ